MIPPYLKEFMSVLQSATEQHLIWWRENLTETGCYLSTRNEQTVRLQANESAYFFVWEVAGRSYSTTIGLATGVPDDLEFLTGFYNLVKLNAVEYPDYQPFFEGLTVDLEPDPEPIPDVCPEPTPIPEPAPEVDPE